MRRSEIQMRGAGKLFVAPRKPLNSFMQSVALPERSLYPAEYL